MKGRFIFLTFAFLVFCAAVGYADPLLLLVLGVLPLVWVGVPALLISGILLFIAFRKGSSRKSAAGIFMAVFAYAAFVGLALPANRFVQNRAVDEAKAYPGQIAPLLETYRKTHGAYPATLEQVPSAPPLPRLLRGGGYQSDGQSYLFWFPKPGGLMDIWDYDSRTRTWSLST